MGCVSEKEVASHDNSGKDHRQQGLVAANLAERIALGDRNVVGVMLESFLVAGRQDLISGQAPSLVYGQSITDACVDWEDTTEILEHLARALVRRRG
jgi:3-deoxy-7-phosphoheptulonate synthase